MQYNGRICNDAIQRKDMRGCYVESICPLPFLISSLDLPVKNRNPSLSKYPTSPERKKGTPKGKGKGYGVRGKGGNGTGKGKGKGTG